MTKEVVTITVEGMSCNHCVNTIKQAVGALNGVDWVNVDLERKKVTVEFDDEKISSDIIKATIEDQGYEVK